MRVKRGFVDIEEGQVHFRHAGAAAGTTLVMLHASPGSSKLIEGLVGALGRTRRVIAPDTLGNGDSCAPTQAVPEIADYAAATVRVLDALKLQKVDLYGTHTGARIATCLALSHPDRVGKLILDGFGLYTPADLDEILKVYAPEVQPDQNGTHIMWCWHFIRDQYLFFPWFKKTAANRYAARDLPDAHFLHEKFIEVMKGITTYHKSYRAAFRYAMRDTVPQLKVPTLLAFQKSDMVHPAFEEARKLLPGAALAEPPGVETEAGLAETAEIYCRFLDQR